MAERDVGSRLRRAVKDNNLPLVRRLIQRTGIRNPDPDHKRYTSLAWAAALGHEETFEFLLSVGHDDDETSKDADNDTILILLAETKGASVTSPYRSAPDGPSVGAAVRMAKLYYDRNPETLDWSNDKGRTALHVAALKGNEELVEMLCDLGGDPDLTDNDGNTPLHYASAWGHVPIVQILIERGCQYTVRNNEGFTASDYAYSYSTKETLQTTARAQYETLKNKRSRRNILQARTTDRASPPPPPVPPKASQDHRARSGSGASYSTGTSDEPAVRHQPSYSSLSTAAHSSSHGSSSTGTLHSPVSTPASLAPPATGAGGAALSPVASRMRAHDQDAMKKFMSARTRTRSGSADISADYSGAGADTPEPYYPADGDALAALADLSGGQRRRLRPSQSASQLKGGAASMPLLNTNVVRDPAGARLRSGTGPAELSPADGAPPWTSPTRTVPTARPSFNREESSRHDRDREGYTGPPRVYAHFPDPPQQPPPPGVAPIIPAPLRRDTAESVKTPTQATSGARRNPFKLSKGGGGSMDSTRTVATASTRV